MDFKEQFHMPMPVINRDTNRIYIETSNSCSGALIIKNDGGGEIEGHIMSNSAAITFDPENFCGNDSKILFYINSDYYSPGDVLDTSAVIISNGGEHLIDFYVKIVPYAIETKEGMRISSLTDFYDFAVKYPISARQLLVSHEFMMWLYSSGYEHMDLYEKITGDSNKERALDNFFILNNLKKKAKIICRGKNIDLKLSPYTDGIYTENILLEASEWGYLDEEITVKNSSPWLRLEKSRLFSSDFDETFSSYLSLFIDPRKLENKINIDTIQIGESKIILSVVKRNYIEVRLEKEFLSFDESSHLIISNYSGKRLTVDAIPQDSFIKFESNRFFIGENARIPFKVEIPALQQAQLSLTRQPVINTTIVVESIFDKKPFVKELNLTLSTF